ncbi:Holliday junction resolvase RuvX [Candidatus Aerophobetes bacterium]|uniref:Putative pre-16S rRNA nuclease n=1 Tax=Aerophobetes bacterium TaxID=2030807 RepID=A0A2A4X7Y0_UNCAE|nr:MAG: Holliday junction resolvase RuvX [Candidatus Aerophobetes bacterium]
MRQLARTETIGRHMGKRLLGIDYGTKRIGLAISDPRQIIASPLARVATKKNHKETAQAIKAVLEEKNFVIEKVVLGDPKLLSGEPSPLSKIIALFAKDLEQVLECPIAFFDERLTSKQGEKLLIEAKVRRKKRAKVIDTMSATLILQSYLAIPKMP